MCALAVPNGFSIDRSPSGCWKLLHEYDGASWIVRDAENRTYFASSEATQAKIDEMVRLRLKRVQRFEEEKRHKDRLAEHRKRTYRVCACGAWMFNGEKWERDESWTHGHACARVMDEGACGGCDMKLSRRYDPDSPTGYVPVGGQREADPALKRNRELTDYYSGPPGSYTGD